jgi:serine/threonine protein kinase
LTKRHVYTEREARLLARRLLEIVQFIHSKGIVHRDLKADNVLLMVDDDPSSIKLADFGFATFCPTGTLKYKEEKLAKIRQEERDSARRERMLLRARDKKPNPSGSSISSSPNGSVNSTQKNGPSRDATTTNPVPATNSPNLQSPAEKIKEGFLTTRCGTPSYVAPEVLIGAPYNHMVDIWSYGVMLYILLGGCFPFQALNHKLLYRKIRAGDFVFGPDHWKHVSVEAKSLITAFLTPDPNHRMEAST